MEHLAPRVIQIDILLIVELLQHEVTWVIQEIAARMSSKQIEKYLERSAIVQVFTRMNLEASINAILIEDIEDRFPSLSQLCKGSLNQPVRTLRPRIEIGPREGARESRMLAQPEVL